MSIDFPGIVSILGYAVEGLGVIIIILGTGRAVIRYFRTAETDLYHGFRRDIGRAMLVGLDFLVAGDIVRTVVVIDSITDVVSLGLVVVIRTVLVFTIHLEVEGHWPWQASQADPPGNGPD